MATSFARRYRAQLAELTSPFCDIEAIERFRSVIFPTEWAKAFGMSCFGHVGVTENGLFQIHWFTRFTIIFPIQRPFIVGYSMVFPTFRAT